MSQLKHYLKDAKNALSDGDYDEAIECSKSALNLDKNCYFALVFLGKAYSCVKELGKSKQNYLKAIEIDQENVLAWKGLFMLFKNTNDITSFTSFDEYFDLCGRYAEILTSQQLPMVDLVNDIREFRRRFKDSQESFLRHMRPGTPMAERLSRHLISPQDALKGLLEAVSTSERQQVSKVVSRERLKISANDPNYQFKINSLAWQIYENSEVDELYQQLVNITDDDITRRELESDWLEYRIRVLKSMPREIKSMFFEKVKSMVEDMIIVEHDSVIAWNLYFEWQDYQNLNEIDVNVASKFMRKFPAEPLATILYAWICSNFSTYDSKDFYRKTFQQDNLDSVKEKDQKFSIIDSVAEEIDETEKNVLEGLVDPTTEDTTIGLPEEDILGILSENIAQAQQSILAHRIISAYYILSREYESVLHYIKSGISLVALSTRDLGAQLLNSKREFTLNLATAYTYFEAPKNHNAALALFDKLLSENPSNSKAKMGKGLIFIERENWDEANKLLSEVIKEFPDNCEVISELGWSELHLGDPDSAIEKFKYVLNNVEGTDLRVLEFRALNYWRIAKGLIYKNEAEANQSQELIKIAFKQLIQSIKTSETFAPGYSSLGDIYAKYYKDATRAFKCYFKAFELDAGDLVAARYMTEKYCETGNWQSASMIAERVVKAEKSKGALQKANWPYRVLGVSYLEKQKEPESIEWFQSALRVDANDVESWVGLGQAYYACGRLEASIKVFEKAIELAPDHLFAGYFKALSLAGIGEYEQCIEIIAALLEKLPNEESFQVSMVNILIDYSVELFSQGYLAKAVAQAVDSIKRIEYIISNISHKVQNVWISLSKALKLFILVQSKVDMLPIESLVNIFEACELKNTDTVDTLDGINLENLLSDETQDNTSIATKFLVLSAKCSLASCEYENIPRTVRASLWYNLGIAELFAYITLKAENYRDAAIICYKQSIKLQSNTTEAWIGLGISCMDVNYRVAQHCFIKAIALAPKEIGVWYDLAILALKNGDIEFARDVLMKSQSIAPQDSSPWFGMALAHEHENNLEESSRMFAHSFVISNGRSKVAQLLYAKSVLRKRIGKGDDERDIEPSQEFTAVACGLDQYLKKSPNDTFAIQCAILTLERLHNFSVAGTLSDRLASILENRFEKSQNEAELFNFAIIESQFARVKLGLKDYESAIEKADLALGILAEHETSVANKAVISNHVVLGLSYFYLDDFDRALDNFKVLLEKSNSSKHLVILISRILYNVNTDETKEIALQELVEYISSHGAELIVTLTIAAISILEGRREDLRAILTELKTLPLDEIIRDSHRDISFLIEETYKRLHNYERSKEQWQRTAFFFPNNVDSWKTLNKKVVNRISSGGQNKVTAKQLSTSLCSLGNVSNIQRSLFLCPWNKQALASLRECF